ncbi:hypothetical protein HI914_06178 [Erysiphe necator]|nr:hypothetical protein HI914_06178 [Erysiphe necator]
MECNFQVAYFLPHTILNRITHNYSSNLIEYLMEDNRKLINRRSSLIKSKLKEAPLLLGYENYHTWALAMANIWQDMEIYDVVVMGERPKKGASMEEIETYKSLCREAINIFYDDPCVVQDEILHKLSKELQFTDPYMIWRYLEVKYKNEKCINSFNALVFQISSIMMGLSSFYDSSSSQDISTLVEKFENEWLLLQKIAEDHKTNSFCQRNLTQYLHDDSAKCQVMIGFLGDHCKNIFNDEVINDHFSFAHVKGRLLKMESEIKLSHEASQNPSRNCKLDTCNTESNFGISHLQKSEHRSSHESQQFSINHKVEKNDVDINPEKISLMKEHFSHRMPERLESINEASPKITAEPITIDETPQKLQVKDDEEHFDYSKAPSLLHGTKREGNWEQSTRKKPFDPYFKNMDVRNNVRRPPISRAGKSHTFRH